MAENPPISDDGIPLRVSDEMFVLERKNVEIEVKLENCKPWGKRSATGKLYMTTCRLVFVNDKFRNSDFKSFDIPLFNIFKEKFEQPIFGSNYLDIKVKPLYGLIPDIASVKLWFKSGGCHKFLKLFDVVLREVRQFKSKNQIRGFNQRVQNGQFANNAAYSDPSDPTVIFVTQPQQMMNGAGNNYYQQPFQGQGQQIGSNNPGFIPPNPMQMNNPPNQQIPNQQQQYNPNQQFPPNQQYDPNQQFNPNQQYNPNQQQQFNQNNPQMQQQQQPQQQANYNYPQQQEGQQNLQNQQQQQQPQQQQNQQPDAGFYFGFFGPQLQNNRY